ncbi:MAG: bifunctional DNA primase/polymerase [Gordonia sp. (in: high G+C Gram-positive bacteria)]|uniref:bifunctional DNA primase/polymerase n=1 Tax=Gordonia sp. (in: high G+C Gram-positive bacteria) TaxID=84139 RepID=UPI0039E57C67
MTDLGLRDAALAYAEAGWFVFPLAPGRKDQPVVKYSTESTRDPDQINEWWQANPDYGIALHVGRSGAVAFDLDRDDLAELPGDMADALRLGVFQSSRRGMSDRGHYVFANGGLEYSNSAKAFGPYGEVRGKNGYIVAAPTPHAKAEGGGGYQWAKPAAVPELPEVLREVLRHRMQQAPADEQPTFTEPELRRFLDAPEHQLRSDPGRFNGPRNLFRNQVEAGVSIHVTLLDALCWALREVRAGAYSAMDVVGVFQTDFHDAFTWPTRTPGDRDRPGDNEFYDALAWAAAQVQPEDPEALRQRMERLAEVDEEAFWTARPELEQLRTFARARRVGPWATFGAVLARAVAVIPPSVVLPPLRGGHGSLNLFVAVVAPSGKGKGTAESAAEDFLITDPDVHEATPGSGEGIPKEYAYKQRTRQVDVRNSVLFTVPEVDSLAALKNRSGSTLMAELRKAWVGEPLGFSYAAEEKKLSIRKHRYRMTMVVGVQPGRSQTLFEDADGGTPQRFLWFPTTDPHRPKGCPLVAGEPLRLSRWRGGVLVTTGPTLTSSTSSVDDDVTGTAQYSFDLEGLQLSERPDPDSFHVLEVPQVVVDAVDAETERDLDGDYGNELDSHGTLLRMKIAAALMWLNGRTDAITDEDWELAGAVKAISDRTRTQAVGTLREQANTANEARAKAEAARDVIRKEVTDQADLERTLSLVRKHLCTAGRMTRREGTKKLKPELRPHFDEVIDRLVGAGVAAREEGKQGSYTVVWKEAE